METRNRFYGNVKKSLSTIAYESIKEMILNDQIKEGEIIPESALAKTLEMSRTPVREAIRKLENEGILTAIDGVGTFVNSISLKDLIDMYEVRVVIECIALRSSIKNIGVGEIVRVRDGINEILFMLQAGVEEEDCIKKLFILDTELHDLIISKSDNAYAQKIMAEINFKIKRNRKLAYDTHSTSKESAIQHLELIDAILERDYEKAAGLLGRHINWSLGVLENFILRR